MCSQGRETADRLRGAQGGCPAFPLRRALGVRDSPQGANETFPPDREQGILPLHHVVDRWEAGRLGDGYTGWV